MRILLLALLLPLLVPAQPNRRKARTPKAAPAPTTSAWPVQSIQINGLTRYAPDSVAKVAGLSKGMMLGKTELDAARQRLLDHGAFDTVAAQYAPAGVGNGVHVTVEVRESNALFPLFFERLPVEAAKLTALLRSNDPLFGDKVAATPPLVARYRSLVAAELAKNNHTLEINALVEAGPNGQPALIFRPKGARPVIAQVFFSGNEVFSEGALREAMGPVAIGVVYREDLYLEMLKKTLIPLYEERGHLQLKFLSQKVEEQKEVRGFKVSAVLEEGPAFTLADVKLENVGGEPQEILTAAGFVLEETANMTKIAEATEKLLRGLRTGGYIRATVDTERQLNEKKKELRLTLRATLGDVYTFRNLTIKGLTVQSEPEVRRLWGPKPGAVFNPNYPDFFLNQLNERQIFDNMKHYRSEVKYDDAEHTADVTLLFGSEAMRKPLLQ
jgi:outer membrane protein assembly factor BamA